MPDLRGGGGDGYGVSDGHRVLLYVHTQVDRGGAPAAGGVHGREGREVGEREGEMCGYGAAGAGGDGRAEEDHDLGVMRGALFHGEASVCFGLAKVGCIIDLGGGVVDRRVYYTHEGLGLCIVYSGCLALV